MTGYKSIESYWGYVRWNLDEWDFWKKYNKYKIDETYISRSKKHIPYINKNLFNFPDEHLKDDYLKVVQDFVSAFSSENLQSSYDELYDIVDAMNIDELYDIFPEYSQYGDSISRFLDSSEDTHQISYLKKLRQQLQTYIVNEQYIIVLLVAYYFTELGLYVPEKFPSKKTIQSILNKQNLSKEDMTYAQQFSWWMKSYLLRHIHNAYTVVYYLVYTKFWRKFDCRDLKKTKKIDEMYDFFEQLYSTGRH